MFWSAGCTGTILRAEGFSCSFCVIHASCNFWYKNKNKKVSTCEFFKIFGHQNPGSVSEYMDPVCKLKKFCWIRICIKSMRIHNPVSAPCTHVFDPSAHYCTAHVSYCCVRDFTLHQHIASSHQEVVGVPPLSGESSHCRSAFSPKRLWTRVHVRS